MTRISVVQKAKDESKKLNKPVWIWSTLSGQDTWSANRHSRWVMIVFPDGSTLSRDFDQEPWQLTAAEQEEQEMLEALERQRGY